MYDTFDIWQVLTLNQKILLLVPFSGILDIFVYRIRQCAHAKFVKSHKLFAYDYRLGVLIQLTRSCGGILIILNDAMHFYNYYIYAPSSSPVVLRASWSLGEIKGCKIITTLFLFSFPECSFESILVTAPSWYTYIFVSWIIVISEFQADNCSVIGWAFKNCYFSVLNIIPLRASPNYAANIFVLRIGPAF